jgi:hypothetical protein
MYTSRAAVAIKIPAPTEPSTKAVATGSRQQRSGRLTDRLKPERKRNGTIITSERNAPVRVNVKGETGAGYPGAFRSAIRF